MARHFRVTADGGSRGNPGAAAYGAVVYEDGRVIQELGETIGIASNNVAEYRGLIAGLQAAHALDPEARIDVNMDSKLVVEQMSGRWQIKHPDMRTLAKAARETHPMSLVTFAWIPRDQNSHADRLANKALDGKNTVAELIQRNYLTERLLSKEIPTTIYFVRHGETVLTPERRFSGDSGSNPELSDIGMIQAIALAPEVTRRKPDVLVASPLQRTRQTAEKIAEASGLEINFDPQWVECSFGLWEGMTPAEVALAYPNEYAGWLASSGYRPPEGESYDEVAIRIDAGIVDLVEKYPGKRVAVVAHNGVIKAAAMLAMGGNAESIFHMDVQTCSITTILIWPSDGLRAVRSLNERAHLNY